MTPPRPPHYPAASIHGRFQPFHNEHLQYALAALARCDLLWIGLSDPFPAPRTIETPAHRKEALSHPLTYHERQLGITAVLLAEGIAPTHFRFTPFPVSSPELLARYLAPGTPCFTTINDDWNRQKIAVLEAHGYQVEVLWEAAKAFSSTEIREAILAGEDRWMEHMPPAMIRFLHTLGFRERLLEIREAGA